MKSESEIMKLNKYSKLENQTETQKSNENLKHKEKIGPLVLGSFGIMNRFHGHEIWQIS